MMCWAFFCNHYNVRETCKFFRFPKDKKLRALWMKLLRRKEEPGPGAYVCSCHFPEGKKDNLPKIHSFNEVETFTLDYSPFEKTTGGSEKEDSTSQRSKKNSATKQNPLSSVVEKTIQDKQEIVNRSNAVHKTTTDQGDNKDQDDPSPKKKLRSAPKADSNDDFDPLDLNNLLLSTTSVLKGMCKELKESTVMNKHVDYSNLDKERITLTTSGGDDEQSLQIVIVNKDPRDTTPSITEATDDLERMLTDVENVVTVEKKCAKETKTISTQTENTFLEVENKKLKLEIASLKSKILSLQNQIQQQDAPKLLFVCNDD